MQPQHTSEKQLSDHGDQLPDLKSLINNELNTEIQLLQITILGKSVFTTTTTHAFIAKFT